MENHSRSFKGYDSIITSLPEADIQIKGVKAWILQGQAHQLVFFEMDPCTKLPEHSHSYPQWGFVIEGETELTINHKTIIRKKGEEYLIPAHAKHSAKFSKRTRLIDLFSENSRYQVKPKK